MARETGGVAVRLRRLVQCVAVLLLLTYGQGLPQAAAQAPPSAPVEAAPALSPAHLATALADPGGLAVAHLLMYHHDQELAVSSAQAVLTALTIAQGLKIVLGRERPDLPGGSGRFTGFSLDDSHHSMPSGHTTAAFAMATVLSRHDPKRAVYYYAAAAMVGLSRIHLARHWPSDVAVGALLGLTVGHSF